MSRLSDDEKRQLRELARSDMRQPPLRDEERWVAPTMEARQAYIRFATQAAKYYRGDKPVRFIGDHWRL